LQYYDLHAFVVMSNHVHILISPLVDPSKLIQSVKEYSAWKANKLLKRVGEPFWQDESYDHWVRGNTEFERLCRYIEDNPVKAGLASKPEDYRWSSAYAAADITNASAVG